MSVTPKPPPLRLVFWELTARCNLKCQHCRAEAQDDFVAGELTTDEILTTADDIRAAGDPIIILTGGEPLVRKDIFQIAEHCVGRFSRVALATNGTLVDAAMAQRIADVGIKRVSISLDGAEPAVHDAFRGQPGCFQEALDGIDALRTVGVPLQINTTVTRDNEDALPALLQMALDLGVSAYHLFMLVPVGCGAEISDDKRLTPERFEEVLVWLARKTQELSGRLQIKATCAPQYYRIIHEMGLKPAAPPPGHGHGGGHGHGAGHGKGHGMDAHTRGCLAGSAVCFISRTGEVQPCGYLPVSAGNVRDEKMASIWSGSELFQGLRDPSSLKGKCGACGYRVLCQGCRARAYAETGDVFEAEPDCPHVPKPRQKQEP